jgi:predicted permease
MIQSVFSTLFNVIVPLSIPVIIEALLARYKNLETKPLLTVSLYYLSPALILDTLLKAQVSHNDVYMTLTFSLLDLLFLWAVANGIGRLLKLPGPEMSGLSITVYDRVC